MSHPTLTSVVAAGLLILLGTSAKAADPAISCHAGKLKESAKYASCRLKAEAKAVQTATTPDFSKCTAKFPSKFNDQETKAGPGICPTEGDGASIDGWLTRDTTDIATLLSGGLISRLPATGQTTSYGAGDDGDVEAGVALQYTDNGDGTITDNATGLIWEKKVLGTGGTVICTDETGTCANPHHADNSYGWGVFVVPYEAFDGTVVTIFLEQLNDRCDQDTTVSCTVDADCAVPGGACGFAGHRDWRLPNSKELQSIVDASTFDPAVAPAFNGANCGAACSDLADPLCSCTNSTFYWSGTTYAPTPNNAVGVAFYDGSFGSNFKSSETYARAVRGPS